MIARNSVALSACLLASIVSSAARAACGDPATFISAVQGTGAASALVGERATVEGVVTAVFAGREQLRGFFMQEELGHQDGDTATSEGLFIYAPTLDTLVDGTLTPGALVRVSGTVKEHRGRTELERIEQILACGVAESPPATEVPGDFLAGAEAVEGMLVTLGEGLVVSDHFGQSLYGEVVLAPRRLMQGTQVAAPGAAAAAVEQRNAATEVLLDDARNGAFRAPLLGPDNRSLDASNTLRAGTRITGLAIVDEAFDRHRLQPVALASSNPNPRPAPPVRAPEADLRVVGFNVFNFFTTLDTGAPVCGPGGDQGCRGASSLEAYGRQLAKLAAAIAALDADVIGVMEVENNGFGTTSAMLALAGALEIAQPDARYAVARPEADAVGDDVISVGLLFRSDRVRLVPGSSVVVLDDSVVRDFLPDAPLPLFNGDSTNRASLAATFELLAGGDAMTVAVNHFKSKGPSSLRDDAACAAQAPAANCDQGDGQGYWNARRTAAARAVTAWLAANPTAAPAESLVLGDINAYAREAPLDAFRDAGYVDLAAELIGEDAYSFSFRGRWGTLDYALGTGALAERVVAATEWHINADEPRWLDYRFNFPNRERPPKIADYGELYAPDPYRASDHDPIVVDFSLAAVPAPAGHSADLNDDGVVDSQDYRLLLAALGARVGAPYYDVRADLDGNGVVDIRDLIDWFGRLSA